MPIRYWILLQPCLTHHRQNCRFPLQSASVKALSATLLIIGALLGPGWARDCTTSKEFALNHPQVLAGVLEDPIGAPIPGVGLEILANRKIVESTRTNRNGEYTFREVAPGHYRIHISYGGGGFCAPKVKCDEARCSIERKVQLDSKGSVTVY